MALMWVFNTFVFMLFVSILYLIIMLITGILVKPFDVKEPEYDEVIFPYILKGQPATKKRWAKKTQDDSFANAIMWADLGND
jgi:hypothetical protein